MTETNYNKDLVSDDAGVYIDSYQTTITNVNIEINEHWFCAETTIGNVYIGIKQRKVPEVGKEIPKLLQKVIALGDVEEFIQALEDWLKCGLYIKPVSIIPTTITKLSIDIENKTKNSAIIELQIGLYNEMLDKLSGENLVQLNYAKIEAEQIRAKVILSQLSITQNQHDKIQKGCIFLIPESYEEKWNIIIMSKINKKISNMAILNKDLRTISDNTKYHVDENTVENEDQETTHIEKEKSYLVKISTSTMISLDYMLCWGDEDKYVLSSTLRKNDIDIYCDSRITAKGKLIRVANGYGIYIEHICR